MHDGSPSDLAVREMQRKSIAEKELKEKREREIRKRFRIQVIRDGTVNVQVSTLETQPYFPGEFGSGQDYWSVWKTEISFANEKDAKEYIDCFLKPLVVKEYEYP